MSGVIKSAIVKKDIEVIKQILSSCRHLIQSKCSSDLCDLILHHAVVEGLTEVVQITISTHDVDIDFMINGRTALSLAIEQGHKDIVQLLLQHKANPNLYTRIGFPITTAVLKLNKGIIKLLLKYGLNVNRLTKADWDGIVWQLIKHNYSDIFVSLLSQKFAVNYNELLGVAVELGNSDVVSELLNRGADPNHPFSNLKWDSALLTSIECGNMTIAKLLVSFNANVNFQDERYGKTPLMMVAATTKNPSYVQLLLDHKADINIRDRSDLDVLHYAVKNPYCTEIIRMLMQLRSYNEIYSNWTARYDVYTRRKSDTPFIYAITNSKFEAVKTFLECGVQIDFKQSEAVIQAAMRFNDDISKWLVKYLVLQDKLLNTMDVAKSYFIAARSHSAVRSCLKKCNDEVELIVEKIGDTSVSFFDIFKEDSTDKLVSHARNKTLRLYFSSNNLEKKFPIYGRDIRRKFNVGMSWNNFNKLFSYIASRKENRLPRLPYDCLIILLGYLNAKDLESIAEI